MKNFLAQKSLYLKAFAKNFWQRFRALQIRYQITSGIVLLAILIMPKFFGHNGEMPPSKVVEIHKVTLGNILQTTRLLGIITAEKNFTPIAGYEGTVSYLAPAGLHLRTGDIIAKIQNSAIEDAYNTALKASQLADDQYNRQLALLQSKISSKQNVEDKFAALSNTKTALASAKINYDKIVFVAPFDGVVGSPLMHIGSHAKQGDAIVAFYDNRSFVVKFDIPYEYAKILGKDATVTILAQKYPIDFIQQTLSDGTYTIPAHISNFSCINCISGERVEVDLHVTQKQNVIVVPRSCVIIRNHKNFVYKVQDGIADLIPVTLGITEKGKVEVTDGLKEGDTIVLKGQYRLHPGIMVTISEASE